MQTFYHVTGMELMPGDIIEPGAFGEWLDHFSTGPKGTRGNFLVLSRELIFENIRQLGFTDKPSRLEVNFLLEDLRTAHFFGQNVMPEALIYEVSLVDIGAKKHRGDFGWFLPHTLHQQFSFMGYFMSAATHYWAGTPQQTVDASGRSGAQRDFEYAETLTQSPICVERKIGPVSVSAQISWNRNTILH